MGERKASRFTDVFRLAFLLVGVATLVGCPVIFNQPYRQPISVAELPRKAKVAVKAKYPKGAIVRAQEVQTEKQTYWIELVDAAGTEKDLVFDAHRNELSVVSSRSNAQMGSQSESNGD